MANKATLRETRMKTTGMTTIRRRFKRSLIRVGEGGGEILFFAHGISLFEYVYPSLYPRWK